jgi:hypothetical protein
MYSISLELPLPWHVYLPYHFVRINSGHLELKDNLTAKSEAGKPVHCLVMYSEC